MGTPARIGDSIGSFVTAAEEEWAVPRLQEHGCPLRNSARRQHRRTCAKPSESGEMQKTAQGAGGSKQCCLPCVRLRDNATRGEVAVACCHILISGACCCHGMLYVDT